MSQERSLKYLLVYIDIGNSWISPNNTYLYFNQLSLKYFWSFTELHVRCSGHTFRRNDRSRKDKGVEDEPIKHYTDIHVNHDRAWKGFFSRNLYKSVEGYNRWKFYYLHKKFKGGGGAPTPNPNTLWICDIKTSNLNFICWTSPVHHMCIICKSYYSVFTECHIDYGFMKTHWAVCQKMVHFINNQGILLKIFNWQGVQEKNNDSTTFSFILIKLIISRQKVRFNFILQLQTAITQV